MLLVLSVYGTNKMKISTPYHLTPGLSTVCLYLRDDILQLHDPQELGKWINPHKLGALVYDSDEADLHQFSQQSTCRLYLIGMGLGVITTNY